MATAFQTKKQKILEQLEIPSQDYTDLSPKGSVDEGVRELVDEINKHDGFVTTSSCAGRVAVYLEGISKRARREEDHENEPAGIASGGKGGGQWLYVSHDPPSLAGTEENGAVCSLLNLPKKDEVSSPESSENVRFVRLKFEPLILHILTASISHAHKALSAALTSGFRESGISSITPDGSVVVAVRTAGLAFDSIIAYVNRSGELVPMVQEDYLRTLLQVANERFEVNSERKGRFREAFLRAIDSGGRATRETKEGWEPAEQRRERKRAEGLRRKAEVQQQKSVEKEDERNNDLES